MEGVAAHTAGHRLPTRFRAAAAAAHPPVIPVSAQPKTGTHRHRFGPGVRGVAAPPQAGQRRAPAGRTPRAGAKSLTLKPVRLPHKCVCATYLRQRQRALADPGRRQGPDGDVLGTVEGHDTFAGLEIEAEE